MWASIYEGLEGRVDWYVLFSEEKGQLQDDLDHAKMVYNDLLKSPFDDEVRNRSLAAILKEIIDKFTDKIELLKKNGNVFA
jgi:hypothetical protein